jgi:hypothetical protein
VENEMMFRWILIVSALLCTAAYSQISDSSIKLTNSNFANLSKDVKTFRGVLGGCSKLMAGALFALSRNEPTKTVSLVGIKSDSLNQTILEFDLAVENLDERTILSVSRPVETAQGTFIFTAQSDGKIYVSTVDLNKKTLLRGQNVGKFRLGFQLILEVAHAKEGFWLLTGQDSDIEVSLLSEKFGLLKTKSYKASAELNSINAVAAASGINVSTRTSEQFDNAHITYANDQIKIESIGKRKYEAIALDRNYGAGEYIGMSTFVAFGAPISGTKIMYGRFGKESVFGNNDKSLFKMQYPFPSLGFTRLDEKNVVIGIVTATTWMIHKAPLDIDTKKIPEYSSYKFWLDTTVEAYRPTFDVQLFCPLTNGEFLGVNTADKNGQRGLFVGRFK